MATGGESHHPDTLGIDMVFACLAADEAQGALHVGELGGEMVVVRAQPVVQDKSGDAETVIKLPDLVTLVVEGESAVTASGAYHHRSAIAQGFVWQIDIDKGLVGVGIAFGKRRSLWPQGDFGDFFSISSGEGKQADAQTEEDEGMAVGGCHSIGW